MQMSHVINFAKCWYAPKEVEIVTFSDAAYNIVSTKTHGQTGLIIRLRYREDNHSTRYHLIHWASRKQRRVSHCSYGAEILAAADADDEGFMIKSIVQALNPNVAIKSTLLVDSKGLFDTITTLHENKEYRLR